MKVADLGVWLVECKVQLAPFAKNAIKRSKWLFSLLDKVFAYDCDFKCFPLVKYKILVDTVPES